MSAVAKPVTLEAFLDWENQQELKYEFDGFQPVAMTGATAAHSRIQLNLLGLLFNRLRGHRCQGHGSELKIQVAGHIRYPDAFVVRSPVSPDALVVHDPVAVFEILSPGTSDTDRFEKNREYRDTPSIQQYVILSSLGVARPSFPATERIGLGMCSPGMPALNYLRLGSLCPWRDYTRA